MNVILGIIMSIDIALLILYCIILIVEKANNQLQDKKKIDKRK